MNHHPGWRNPSRGPEDMYALVLLRNGRVFRVAAPMTKKEAQAARRKALREWHYTDGPGPGKKGMENWSGYDAKVVQCWTDWGAQEREEAS